MHLLKKKKEKKMGRKMNEKVSLRPFEKEDIPLKVKWVNDSENNEFLHYDIPLTVEKTQKWWEGVKDREDRKDFIILYEEIPVGLIGLLNIDKKNSNAELHIILGEKEYKGKGIAKKAVKALLDYSFDKIGLDRVYLYVEEKNLAAIKLYEKAGFTREGKLRKHIRKGNISYDYLVFGILKEEHK